MKMFYENYKDRRRTWLDYFSALQFSDPFDMQGNYNPEHFIPMYLKESGPDIELMRLRLVDARNLREKTLLTLLLKEFDTVFRE